MASAQYVGMTDIERVVATWVPSRLRYVLEQYRRSDAASAGWPLAWTGAVP